ncbi:hypothetical protein BDR26DRAFT_862701 [Obelidium mucronatum]|nr:hypothetical protein BDR26DRAFT_862701 [Obelidium mucronatum]
MTSSSLLPDITAAQVQFLDTLVAQVVALPICAKDCWFLYNAKESDPLTMITNVCKSQINFINTYNACSTEFGCIDSDIYLSQAQSIVNSLPTTCSTLNTLFTPIETGLGAFASQTLVDSWNTTGTISNFKSSTTSSTSTTMTTTSTTSTTTSTTIATSFATSTAISSLVSTPTGTAVSNKSSGSIMTHSFPSFVMAVASVVFLFL